MRALRILLVLVLVLGGLFVAADRIAVHYAEGQAADQVKKEEGLSRKPEVDVRGFPFLTQLAAGKLDDVGIRMEDYEADTGASAGEGPEHVMIKRIDAGLSGVEFSGDYASAHAERLSGTVLVAYAELLKAAHAEPLEIAPGISARVASLSDGGKGRVKLTVEGTVLGRKLPKALEVLCAVSVQGGDRITVRADALPDLGVPIAEKALRGLTDFQQEITGLPAGIDLKSVRAASDGVRIAVTGSNVELQG